MLLVHVVASLAIGASLPDPFYLSELQRSAEKARLAEDRFWHLLLHYRPDLLGGYTSEADDPGFFLAPDGKTNPQAELDATLAQFFSGDLVGRSRQPARCAFIARYHWLKERLGFDPERLPPLRCERFDTWLEELAPAGVTLVFPSAFMNNPASMFGHTFLRIDQKGQTEQTRILAYTINFAADVDTDSGVAFAARGMFGGFKGYFSTIPYYLKVQEYGDIENRDIWEYRLDFSDEQVLWMMRHAWELGNAYFDYYFFKENCAYHILSLLEVADPNLHLRDQFLFWTVPADVVRLLTRHPGLVEEVTFRPARSTTIKGKVESLSPEERAQMLRLWREPELAERESFASLTLDRQAFMLDVISDYLRYRTTATGGAEDDRRVNRRILLARSALRLRSPEFAVEPFTVSPEQGHETSRLGAGIGWRNGGMFEEVSIRAGYHDLLDPELGYTPDARIEIGAVTFRRYERGNRYRIERATLANILSLSPIDRLFQAPSWKISLGMESWRVRERGRGCELCNVGVFNTGIGAAVESHRWRRSVAFVFAETEVNISGALSDTHRAGGGGTVGFYADLTERWRVLASGSYLRFPLGDRSEDIRAFLGGRYTLGKDWALRVEYHRRRDDNDVVLALQAFF